MSKYNNFSITGKIKDVSDVYESDKNDLKRRLSSMPNYMYFSSEYNLISEKIERIEYLENNFGSNFINITLVINDDNEIVIAMCIDKGKKNLITKDNIGKLVNITGKLMMAGSISLYYDAYSFLVENVSYVDDDLIKTVKLKRIKDNIESKKIKQKEEMENEKYIQDISEESEWFADNYPDDLL